jgi:hypothetical protein
VLVAAPATARVIAPAEFDQFPDGVNDGDPDIARVVTSSNASGGITFVVEIANRTALSDNEFLQIYIDADAQAGTGAQPNGVDFAIQMDQSDVGLFRWNGSAFAPVDGPTVYGYVFKGFRIGVHKSDLGGVPSGAINYWVETVSGAKSDEAPDGHIAQHRLSTLPLQLTIAGFNAPRNVAVGKRYAVAMRVNRSDLQDTTSAGLVRCTAKVGRATLKVQAVFPEDIAGCIGTAPKSAKKKLIKVTISLTLDGVTVSRTASIRVK